MKKLFELQILGCATGNFKRNVGPITIDDNDRKLDIENQIGCGCVGIEIKGEGCHILISIESKKYDRFNSIYRAFIGFTEICVLRFDAFQNECLSRCNLQVSEYNSYLIDFLKIFLSLSIETKLAVILSYVSDQA